MIPGGFTGQRPFPHLRSAEARYGNSEVRSKYAWILLGGVIVGTKTVECAQCGWTTDARGSTKAQLRAHEAGNPKCFLGPLRTFIGRMTREEKRLCRTAYGDFNLRWLLAGTEDMWRADLERVRPR